MNAKTTKFPGTFMALGGLMAVVGAILSAMIFTNKVDLAGPWMYGAIFWSVLTFGCLGLTMLFHLTRGRWGTPTLRIFESGGGWTHIALSAVVLLGVGFFYLGNEVYGGWLNGPGNDPILQNKEFYLNRTDFLIRSVCFFLYLGGIAFIFRTWTRNEETSGDKKWGEKRNFWGGLAMVGFFGVLTFLTTDYVMSIDPHWYSTIWGVWFAVGGALGAMALAVMIVVSQMDKAPYAGKIDKLMRNDFGNLLLMLTMLWGYFSFSQLLIIWSGNLPEFTTFYLSRLRGGFSGLGKFLFIGQFLFPFLMLLSPSLKRNKTLLMSLGAFILFMRAVDMFWIVMPYFRTVATFSFTDIGPFLLIGGIWLAVFGLNLKSAPLTTTAHPHEHKETMELKEAMDNV